MKDDAELVGTNSPEYVYLIGTERYGFHGHCFDKSLAKLFLKQRRTKYKIKKVKCTKKLMENLSVNTELVTVDGVHWMTAIEEEYFIEAFNQWQEDVARSMKDFLRLNSYIRYTDDEKEDIKELHRFLKGYIKLHDSDAYEGGSELFDYPTVVKFFIDKIMDPGD